MAARAYLCPVLAIVYLSISTVWACSCMHSHPQEHYCSSDFVALVKIKREGKGDSLTTSYQIRVRKEYKMSDKAREALSQGLIWTGAQDSTCGVKLNRTKYLIAGRVIGEKAWVTLCNFVAEWHTLSRKQRKGFRRLYQQGCHCKVRTSTFLRRYSGTHCSWDTVWDGKLDCQSLHSVCVPNHQNLKECTWLPSTAYHHCMKQRKLLKKEKISKEKFKIPYEP